MNMSPKHLIIILLFMTGLVDAATPATVLDSLRGRLDGIEDYQVNIVARFKMPRFRMPRKKMTLAFKQPDKFHLKARGFAAVPRMGVFLDPDSLLARLQGLRVVPDTTVDGERFLALQGTREGEEGKLLLVTALVDTSRWVIRRMLSYTDTTQVVDLKIEYQVIGEWIMPTQTDLRIDFGELVPLDRREHFGPGHASAKWRENGRQAGIGEVHVRFSDYRINTGLPDSLFESEAVEQANITGPEED